MSKPIECELTDIKREDHIYNTKYVVNTCTFMYSLNANKFVIFISNGRYITSTECFHNYEDAKKRWNKIQKRKSTI
jgi:hypothetical protein